MNTIKKLIGGVVVSLLIVISFIFFCDYSVKLAGRNRLYTDVGEIPFNKVGIILGTAKYNVNGNINRYYDYRIKAAVDLIKSGRIRYIIASGDNRRKEYNEPAMMRQDLVKAGIDSSIIFLDYAGFRTFDSMIRVREIFGQNEVTVISQKFHNERALFIAQKEGIEAIGFNAKDVSKKYGYKVQIREKLARVKVFYDYLFGTEPKFLGKKVLIP